MQSITPHLNTALNGSEMLIKQVSFIWIRTSEFVVVLLDESHKAVIRALL